MVDAVPTLPSGVSAEGIDVATLVVKAYGDDGDIPTAATLKAIPVPVPAAQGAPEVNGTPGINVSIVQLPLTIPVRLLPGIVRGIYEATVVGLPNGAHLLCQVERGPSGVEIEDVDEQIQSDLSGAALAVRCIQDRLT